MRHVFTRTGSLLLERMVGNKRLEGKAESKVEETGWRERLARKVGEKGRRGRLKKKIGETGWRGRLERNAGEEDWRERLEWKDEGKG